MNKKMVASWVSLAILLSFIVIIEIAQVVEAPTTWYVDDVPGSGPGNPPEDFTSIQDAINVSNDGDTVYVYGGTYYENVMVNKTINLTGINRDNTTIDGNGIDDVVYVSTNGVNIRGFTIIKSGGDLGDAGIKVSSAQNCRFTNNNISNNYYGIYFTMFSHNNIIKNNNIYSNSEVGIRISSTNNDIMGNNISLNGRRGISLDLSSGNNIITWNNISSNNWDGIILGDSSGNTITYNNIFSHSLYGIRFSGISDNNKVLHNTIYTNGEGIMLWSSPYNNITGNNIFSNINSGIYLGSYSDHNLIMNNNVSNNSEGIMLDLPWSSNNTIIGNHVWNNSYGINLDQPPDNHITNNNVSYNFIGIYLQSSSNNTIMDNIIFNNGDGIKLTSSFDNYISGNNVSRHPNLGGIYLDQSSNTTLKGNYVLDNFYGINIKSSPYCNIIGNNITSGNTYSIHVLESSFSNLSENEVSNNDRGIELLSSSNCTINDNICLLNEGNSILLIFSSNNNTITGNNVLNSNAGIALLDGSINNHVADNNASYNKYGILLFGVGQNNVSNNTMINNGIFIRSSLLSHWNMHNIDTSNTVNGKPVYYWKNKTGGIIPADAGQVILANSTNIRIENHEFINCTVGIEVGFSLNTTIINNTVMSNIYGIYLAYSNENNITGNIVMKNERGLNLYFSDRNNIFTNIVSNNDYCILFEYSNDNNIKYNNLNNNRCDGITLFDSNGSYIILNNISSNNWYGIDLAGSSNNHVYHNNIINNKFQAYDSTNNENKWDNGYPFGGNYWSDFDEPSEGAYDDFKGLDQNVTGSDGMVDNGTIGSGGKNPYIIDSNSQDNYPLISPIGNLTFLYEGWNLISIPFIQSDTNLGTVLSSIKGSYTAVQWYDASDSSDAWKHNCSLKPPHLNDLNDIDHLMGFWIYITKPGGVLFEYFGIEPTTNQTITLQPGWNLVGYPSLTRYNRTQGLNNLTFGTHVDAIWTYNAANQKWKEIGASDYFEIGRGYWVHAKTKCEWQVPL